MGSTVRHVKPFGSDHGLIHEVVVTGRKVGADEEFWTELAHDQELFRRVVELVSSVNTTTASVTLGQAKSIMGANFHGIEALEKFQGWILDSKTKRDLSTSVPFSAEVLAACRDEYVLVACAGLSLVQVHARRRALFQTKSTPWYKDQDFALTQAKAGWYLVRKTPVPGSTRKTWSIQQGLLTEVDEVPNASVLAQAILIHYLETGIRLFEAVSVMVSDVDPDGRQIYLGDFTPNGLIVSATPGSCSSSFLGLSSARKKSS